MNAPLADPAPPCPRPATGRHRLPALLFFSTVFVAVAVDLAMDADHGAGTFHLLVEAVLMAVSAAGAVTLWIDLRNVRREVGWLESEVDTLQGSARAARKEAERWREEASDLLRGLRATIHAQFDRWGLTDAEREVAFLLLKGLSHREAARVRSTSERTVREQAQAVYRKAGLAGRSELAAFFLEDLLVPPRQEGGVAAPS